MDTSAAFARFAQILDTSGARDALAFVLGLSDYRYIGLFRFHDGRANAAIHVDREDPSVTGIREAPAAATYCCYVRDTLGVFSTADAVADARLAHHPKRDSVLAYCGVPVLDPEGELLGTLCHYDVVPRDPARLDMDLLLQVASALQQGRHIPAYPTP